MGLGGGRREPEEAPSITVFDRSSAPFVSSQHNLTYSVVGVPRSCAAPAAPSFPTIRARAERRRAREYITSLAAAARARIFAAMEVSARFAVDRCPSHKITYAFVLARARIAKPRSPQTTWSDSGALGARHLTVRAHGIFQLRAA